MKILIIQQKMIGDVLTSSILCELIKTHIPDSEVHYVINANTYPVVQNNPFVDRFIYVTPETEKNKPAFRQFLKQIKNERYDVVVDAYSKTSSNLMSRKSGARIRQDLKTQVVHQMDIYTCV